MGLKIYEKADPSTAFSVSGAFTNPLSITADGTIGQVLSKQYFVRNDDVLVTYSGISVSPIDNSGSHLIDGTLGFSWKLIEGANEPIEAQWNTVDHSNTISLSDITDTSTYLPFWVRVQVPRAASVQSFDKVILRITATEI